MATRFLTNQSTDVDGTASADAFYALEDLTLGRTLDGLGGTDILIAADLDGDPTTNPEIEISDVIDIASIEEVATAAGGMRLSIGQLASFARIVDSGGSFLDQTYNLTSGIGGSSATLQVVGLTDLAVNGSGAAETLNLGLSFDNTEMHLAGFGGNDVLTSGDGNDFLNGGINNDTLDGGAGGDDLVGGDGSDTLFARDGDALDGDAGAFFSGADRLLVAGTLNSGTLDGGGGAADTLDVEASANAVTIAAGVTVEALEILALDAVTSLTMSTAQLNGFTTITRDGSAATSATLTLSGVGTATTDVTQLTALTVVDQLTSNADNDHLTFTSTNVEVTIDGANGSDEFTTGGGDDILDGGAGADTLDGGSGTDTLDGESGIDTLHVRNFDSAFGGTENDVFILQESLLNGLSVLDGGTGTDILRAVGARTVGNATEFTSIEQLRLDNSLLTLRIEQFEQFDLIFEDGPATTGRIAIVSSGTAASTNVTGLLDLVVTGSTGADALTFTSTGFTPTDIELNAGDLGDTITTGEGADVLRGQNGNDTLNAAAGTDTLYGDAGTDTLIGGGAADDLFGGSQADTLLGGTGADDLQGGAGNDRLTGESGADDFLFAPGGGRDVITDFADGSDQLEISGFGVDFDDEEELIAVAFQAGANVEIFIPNPTSGTTTVVIENFLVAQLDAGDFIL